MYDLFTSAILFFLLVPGTLVTLPPGVSPYISALTHGVVFYLIQVYLPNFVPNWAIWIIAGVVLAVRIYLSTRVPTGILGMGTSVLGGRR